MPHPTPDAKPGGSKLLPDTASLRGAALFELKAFALRRLRSLRDLRSGRARRHPASNDLAALPAAATIRTALWSGDPAGERDRALTAGKIQNLRRAIQQIDGIEVPAGALFSFWAQVGPPTRRRGYVAGRELREGCMVASVGGGLCQLSNALYRAALDAGLEVVERHAHSMVVPGSEAEVGRDATVFWNYIDLRLRSSAPFRIEAHLTGQELVLRMRGGAKAAAAAFDPDAPFVLASDCTRCGQIECRRHTGDVDADAAKAWLIEAPHPEFAAWFEACAGKDDHLFLPTRLGPRGGRWPTGRCPESSADVEAMRRRIAARRATSGARLQRSLLESDARLARSFARKLSHLHTDLVVGQSLLPHLWREGVLQGRRFDVLLDRLPYAQLHAALDAALARHPESPTLGEYRAPADLVDAERAGLAAAQRLVTAHAALARLDPARTLTIQWPAVRPMAASPGGQALLLPASGLARKGAHALREAIHGIDAELLIRGGATEEPDFWGDLPVRILRADEALPPLAAVVLPALIEHRPEPLLAALGAGLKVIATDACGITPRDGLTLVARDDVTALHIALETALAAPSLRVSIRSA